jgi:hypothetical protein
MSDQERGAAGGTLYIWLEGEPGVMPPDVTIPDEPGVNDNDQIADAIRRGDLGRFLPVTIRFSDYENPSQKRVRSLDTARLLRDRHIRHRRRYEVTDPSPQPPPLNGEGESGSEGPS